jgi:ABC-type multidrug transport system fused ATPase/permease subunit
VSIFTTCSFLRAAPAQLSYELDVSAGKVEFRNIELSYTPKGKKVINGIDFEVTPGKTVAFSWKKLA